MDPTEGIDIGFVSTLDFGGVAMGETCVMNAKVEKLEGYEIGSFNWYYSPDAGETWIRIEDADSSCYEYVMSNDNWYYLWKVEVSVLTETETAE